MTASSEETTVDLTMMEVMDLWTVTKTINLFVSQTLAFASITVI